MFLSFLALDMTTQLLAGEAALDSFRAGQMVRMQLSRAFRFLPGAADSFTAPVLHVIRNFNGHSHREGAIWVKNSPSKLHTEF